MGKEDNNPHESVVSGKENDSIKDETRLRAVQDVALGEMLAVESTPALEKRVVLKLDMIMLPLMGVVYMMQYMDKLALSQATLFNLRQDLNLQGQQYSWTSAIFYFGYLVWSPISSYLAVRLPIGKYLTVAVMIWGVIMMSHAATKNFTTLMVARFFLGVGEAAIAPGFSLIVGMFYKREEQPARQSAWFLGNSISVTIGGLVAWGIGNISNSHVKSWQLLFLVLGAITSGLGILLAVLLPDSPRKAIFLTETERSVAVQRTLKNKTGILDENEFRWYQVRMALLDPQIWLLVLYQFCSNLCNGGITSFSAILVNGFGFPPLESLLLQMPSGAAQLVFLPISAAVARFVPNMRITLMMINTSISMMGMILVWKLDEDNKSGRLVGLSFASVFGVNFPLALSLISSNIAGFTKRSVCSSMLFIAYCTGNIVAPQFFLASEEPDYPTGLKGAISGLALAVFFLLCLLVYYIWENKRRDAKYGPPSQLTEEEERMQGLLNKTDRELESFRYVI
ncbi:MFS allantoate transporter [Geosmithia morbida]|uniref:MFS allantoate transporter n=1 Tax=Geosmithia morbida TaxID=1094350 RepID=A0A9P4YW30_9HYPO|nr:MFS allantoate transporter [Geosmithia morbida]KAF4123597.1 MFS allantoate transporter [Geosmithia morbida]